MIVITIIAIIQLIYELRFAEVKVYMYTHTHLQTTTYTYAHLYIKIMTISNNFSHFPFQNITDDENTL